MDGPKTEGQRRLLEVPGSLADIAAAIDGIRSAVSQWRRGEKRPNPAARAKLLEVYGIDPADWERAPGPAEPAPVPPRVASLLDARDARESRGEIRDRLEAELAFLYDLRGRVTVPSESVRISDLISKNLIAIAREDAKRESFQHDAVRRSKEWQQIRAATARALRPFPDAARAVADALGELDETG